MSDTVFIPDPDEPDDPAGTIIAGPFWPDINLSTIRDTMRIGNTTIPTARLRAAAEGALLTVDKDLNGWRTAQEAKGHLSLEDVPATRFGTRSRLVMLYERAIAAFTAADLTETHRDLTATAAGVDKSAAAELTADDHKRNGVEAIRDLKGRARVKVKLV